MNADDILHGLCEQTVGVVVAQVTLIGEGELVEIFDAVDVTGRKSFGVHALTEAFHFFVHSGDLRHQALALEFFNFLARHTFDFGIADRHGGVLSFLSW